MAQWFWRRTFLDDPTPFLHFCNYLPFKIKMFNVFLLFCYYLPLGKRVPFHLNNLESPTLKMICAKSGQNWPSGSGEEVENVKVYRQTDGRTTYNKRSEKLT
jgi:hypothetical protein